VHEKSLDEYYEKTILYLIRDHGRLQIETEHWTMGIFYLGIWRTQHISESNADELATLIKRFLSLDFIRPLSLYAADQTL